MPPGLSLALEAARSKQGGTGGGPSCRTLLKSVGYAEAPRAQDTGVGVGGGGAFLRLEARLNFCAALRGDAGDRVQQGPLHLQDTRGPVASSKTFCPPWA